MKPFVSRSRKPYPGIGRYVVVLDYDGTWVAHGGANTPEGARKLRAKLPQWPADKVKIVDNVPGGTRP